MRRKAAAPGPALRVDPLSALLVAAASASASSAAAASAQPHLVAVAFDYEASFKDPELWALLTKDGRRAAAATTTTTAPPEETNETAAAAASTSPTATATMAPAKSKKQAWTASEDAALRAAVAELGCQPWKLIAARLGLGRSDIQCFHRWTKVIRPGLKKGAWTATEDETLAAAVTVAFASAPVAGDGRNKVDWSKVAAQLPGRIGKSCCERWGNHLRPGLRTGDWTAEEEQTLMRAQAELGNRWSDIEKQLPGRPANAIKNHYHKLARRQALQEGAGWEQVGGTGGGPTPKRGRRIKAAAAALATADAVATADEAHAGDDEAATEAMHDDGQSAQQASMIEV